ncbi:hypothetical protein CHARACLAT_007634 [Characodon lateralis]|uniref:Secreted protein n=1 Tax=Characodon lateralis TaxID=208331 RepID=A0ABU7CVP9_9TELE|nr:hypothetical protein [Characodon lateralis]
MRWLTLKLRAHMVFFILCTCIICKCGLINGEKPPGLLLITCCCFPASDPPTFFSAPPGLAVVLGVA